MRERRGPRTGSFGKGFRGLRGGGRAVEPEQPCILDHDALSAATTEGQNWVPVCSRNSTIAAASGRPRR